jgi:uncharacterized membrane protein YhaH (DUF805 family)
MIFFIMLMIAAGKLSGAGNGIPYGFDLNDLFRIADPAAYRSLSWAALPPLAIKVIGTALFLWVYAATSIKRLHDRDKSGFWMLPFFVIPGLYNQFSDRLPHSWFMLIPAVIAFVFCVWGSIELYFRKGSRKTNRFGPNPLLKVETRPRWDQNREVEMVPHTASPPPVLRVKRGP